MLISPSIPADWFCPGSTKYSLYRFAAGSLSDESDLWNLGSSFACKFIPVGNTINVVKIRATRALGLPHGVEIVFRTNTRRIRDVKEFGRSEYYMHRLQDGNRPLG